MHAERPRWTPAGHIVLLTLETHIGDWFHYVANLIEQNSADKNFLNKVGVVKETDAFREAIQVVKTRISALADAWSRWPGLKEFQTK